MADKKKSNPEDLQARLDELETQNKELAQANEELAEAANSSTAPKKVPGTFTAEVRDGKETKKVTASFRAGAVMTRLQDGTKVPSAELMKAAKEAEYSSKDYPQLTHEVGRQRMTQLVRIRYGLLEFK